MKIKHLILKPEMDMKKIRKDFLKSDADALFLQAEYVYLPHDAINLLAQQLQGNIQCISGWVPTNKKNIYYDNFQAWNALKLFADHRIAHAEFLPGITMVDYTTPECFLVSREIIKKIKFNFKKRRELQWITGFRIITDAFMNFCNDIYENGYAIYMNGDVVCDRIFPPQIEDVDDPPIHNKKDKVVVVFTIDNRYVIPLSVAMKTLVDKFSKDRKLKIIVGDVGITQDNKDKLNKIYPIEFIRVNIDEVKKIKINIVYHTPAIFARLILAEKLDINKILYLDPDIIIQDDITKLWDMDISDYVLAAAQDDTIPERDSYIYFNSGVMLINLKKWKEQKITKKAIKFVSKNITNHTDQDALNDILKGNYLRFSKKWNSNPISGRSNGLKIMHFLGSEKPWWYGSKMSIVPEYYRLIDTTPFRGWRPSMPQKEITII